MCAQGVLKGRYLEQCRACTSLPLDLDLGAHFVAHSTFTCPVSKEVATAGNPPAMLPCGHVLALTTVAKLARPPTARGGAHFQCPYCKEEASVTSACALAV